MNPLELHQHPEIQLLDVRLADDFEAMHLSGARNNCVFEVAFLDRLADSAPNPHQTTVVYGANSQSQEAAMAADKLARAGYSDIRLLEGGLAGAIQLGLEVQRGTPLPPSPIIRDGVHDIDLMESRVEWTGRNLLNKHWGTAALKSGNLIFQGGQLQGGEFVIDLTRLECADLEGSDLHDVLIAHLHSDDFFDVTNFPEARFIVSGVAPADCSSPGAPNLDVAGNLTLRGQTHPIQFIASAGITDEGKPAAQAAFAIDRTRWGVLYGSGKFFQRLAGHVVNDEIEFQLRMVTV